MEDNKQTPAEKPSLFQLNADDITLSFLYRWTTDYFVYMWDNWWALVVGTVVGAGLGVMFFFIVGVTYTTDFSFKSEASTSSVLQTAVSLAGTFGIGGSVSSGYDNTFFASYLSSNNNVKSTLLKKETISGRTDLLANFFLDQYYLRDGWDEVPNLKNFRFTATDVNHLSHLEDSILSIEFGLITTKYMIITNSESEPFVDVTYQSSSFDFSRIISTDLLDGMNNFFLTQVYYKNNINYEYSEHKVDSLQDALNFLDASIARVKDATLEMQKQQGLVLLGELTRQQSLVSALYANAQTSLDVARSTMENNPSVLQIIDAPQYSTIVTKWKITYAILIGGFLGVFFTFGIALVVKLFQDSIGNNKIKAAELKEEKRFV
jgi:hypothetical protein